MKPVIIVSPVLWIALTAQIQFSPGQRMQARQQDQTGKASIEGSVVDSLTNEPVKKATVTLNGRLGLNAVTDASGRFAFRQLPAGQYLLQAHSEKYPFSRFVLDLEQQLSISLGAEEQKQDITLSLIPGASVRGHLVDEDGNAMSGCNVAAIQLGDGATGRQFQQGGNSQTDEKGEYRISNLPHGKYYIQAHCYKSVPLPHPFIRRASAVDVPALTYAPLFYPAAEDPASAAKIQVLPGADISGIDFRMAPARGITVRGHLGPATGRNIQLIFEPKSALGGQWRTQTARVNSTTGEFQIPNVRPGTYDLTANVFGEGPAYYAKASVEVGDAPLEPIELTLAEPPTVSGSISMEGDAKVPINSIQIMMNPVDGRPMMGPPQPTHVQDDGTFAVKSVLPGHWRLNVNGMPGYVKSVRQGDREVTPWDLEIGASPVELKIVIGTKFSQVVASLATSAAGSESVSAMLWSANGDPLLLQNIGLTSQGPSRVRVTPGKYYACAFTAVQPWMLMQNLALRKALEGRCATVEATEDADATVQLPLIPAADLKQMLEKIEE